MLLIARDREHVLEWQWAANESAQAYTALLDASLLPMWSPPTVLQAPWRLSRTYGPPRACNAAWSTFIVTSSAT